MKIAKDFVNNLSSFSIQMTRRLVKNPEIKSLLRVYRDKVESRAGKVFAEKDTETRMKALDDLIESNI